MSSYRKGRRFEYQVRDFLEQLGWVVLRCAKSRPFDLVALKDGKVVLIECKLNGKPRPDQRALQEELAKKAGAAYVTVERKPGWKESLSLLLSRL